MKERTLDLTFPVKLLKQLRPRGSIYFALHFLPMDMSLKLFSNRLTR